MEALHDEGPHLAERSAMMYFVNFRWLVFYRHD